MADGGDALTVRIIETIDELSAAEWDACAGTGNPFTSHAFLAALESSGSATAKTGWAPHHLVAQDAAGRVLGVAPNYLKSHSYGEYVFDHGWADAYRRAGGSYYPKLQVAVPFTPVPGRRLLCRPGDTADGARAALIEALRTLVERAGLSSAHATFCSEEEARSFAEAGWLIRRGFQYHWSNDGYRSFDDFLARLNHSKRKTIKRERREVAAQGLSVEMLTGAALTPAHWDAFFELYIATSDRKWGSPYLTREFFHELGRVMPERVALVLARHGDRHVGGALNLIGEDTLYGRNWGGRGDYPFLHFEACYYQAIEFAIGRGLAKVEAGAQGDHKLPRGYLPVPTYSAHWIRDRGFRKAVADFLRREGEMIAHEIASLGDYSPFKKTGEN